MNTRTITTSETSHAWARAALTAAAAAMAATSRAILGLLRPVASLFVDKRGHVSRPKLLFVIAFLDALSVAVAGSLVSRLAEGFGAPVNASLWRDIAIGLLVVAVLHRNWSYSISALRNLSRQVIKVVTATLTVFLAFAGVSYVWGSTSVPAPNLVLWMLFAMMALTLSRIVASAVVERLAAAGCLRRRTVIAGGGKEADDLLAALTADDTGHLDILGIFDDRQGERAIGSSDAIVRLGTFEELSVFCQNEGVDLAIVTVPPRAEERLLDVLRRLFSLQVDIRVSAHNSKLRFNSSAYSYIGKIPMLAVMDKPLSDWDRVMKNVEDRVLGAAILLVVSPIMALVALAVRLDSKGPILFKQRRYGFNNELVEVYKFRSMYVEQSDATANKLVTRSDPRVTRVGRIIRRTSLDELPQLFNVLKGEMSLVGPRPHATQAKAGQDLYEDVVQGYFARHRVKPGVTGWAQVNGWRGETDTPDKIQRRVECDLHYIDNWSVLFDLYIIAMTPFVLLTGKNAY